VPRLTNVFPQNCLLERQSSKHHYLFLSSFPRMGIFAATFSSRSFRRWFASLLVVSVIVYLLSDRSASLGLPFLKSYGGLGSSAPAPLRLDPGHNESGEHGLLVYQSCSLNITLIITILIERTKCRPLQHNHNGPLSTPSKPYPRPRNRLPSQRRHNLGPQPRPTRPKPYPGNLHR